MEPYHKDIRLLQNDIARQNDLLMQLNGNIRKFSVENEYLNTKNNNGAMMQYANDLRRDNMKLKEEYNELLYGDTRSDARHLNPIVIQQYQEIQKQMIDLINQTGNINISNVSQPPTHQNAPKPTYQIYSPGDQEGHPSHMIQNGHPVDLNHASLNPLKKIESHPKTLSSSISNASLSKRLNDSPANNLHNNSSNLQPISTQNDLQNRRNNIKHTEGSNNEKPTTPVSLAGHSASPYEKRLNSKQSRSKITIEGSLTSLQGKDPNKGPKKREDPFTVNEDLVEESQLSGADEGQRKPEQRENLSVAPREGPLDPSTELGLVSVRGMNNLPDSSYYTTVYLVFGDAQGEVGAGNPAKSLCSGASDLYNPRFDIDSTFEATSPPVVLVLIVQPDANPPEDDNFASCILGVGLLDLRTRVNVSH